MKPDDLTQPIEDTEATQPADCETPRTHGFRWGILALAACLILALLGMWLPAQQPSPVPEPEPVLEDQEVPAAEEAESEPTPEPEPVPAPEPKLPPEEPADSTTIEAVVQELMAQYDLNETNFSLCYYNTVTGESYEYNPDAWMVAASTYKLPLNLYYYEQEAAGLIDPASYISGVVLSVDGLARS